MGRACSSQSELRRGRVRGEKVCFRRWLGVLAFEKRGALLQVERDPHRELYHPLRVIRALAREHRRLHLRALCLFSFHANSIAEQADDDDEPTRAA